MFEFEDVELEFTREALDAIADQALLRGTGARGLRAILEEVLLNTMYELPGRSDVGSVVIDADTVPHQGEPHAGAARAGHQAAAPPGQLSRRCPTMTSDELRRRARVPRRRTPTTTPPAASSRPRSSACVRSMAAMGDPQLAYPVIHVTGTNGKGSTTQMITRLLMAHGLTVGTYTSPHLERLNERISRNCEPISDDEFAEQIAAVADLEGITGVRPSLLRGRHRRRVPLVRRRRRRRRRRRGRPARPVGRHQRVRRAGGGRHQHRRRPHRVRRPHARRTSPPRRRASSSPAARW